METPHRKKNSFSIQSKINATASVEVARHVPAQSSSSSSAAVDYTVDRSLILGHNPGSNIEEAITEEEIRPTGGADGGSILEPGQGLGESLQGQGLGPPQDMEQGQGLEDVHLSMNDLELRASEDEREIFLNVNNSVFNLNNRSSYLNGTYHCRSTNGAIPPMHYKCMLPI